MGAFHYRDGILHCEEVSLLDVAMAFGTPLYAYSRNRIQSNAESIRQALSDTDHMICYSLKANSNPSLLRLLSEKGCGADVVSGGELKTALNAGIPAERIVFAGVGKTDIEIEEAIRLNIFSINVESFEELHIVHTAAERMRRKARIAIRVNPVVNARTHPYIATGLRESKFGIPIQQAREAFLLAKSLPALETTGIHFHIGSMILEKEPFIEAVQSTAELIRMLEKSDIHLKHIDIGGGIGVDYTCIVEEETPKKELPPPLLFSHLRPLLSPLRMKLIFEPGRYMVADTCALVSTVVLTKETGAKKFIVVDAGMNDLIRPSLYSAYHQIVQVKKHGGAAEKVSIVGPICESGDFFAHDRLLPAVKRGDLLAVMAAGAYGYSLSSNYNSRLRAPEILVEGNQFRTIRRRENVEDLWRGTELDRE